MLRRQLVEFETSIGKDFLFKNPSSHYNIGGDIFSYKIRFSLKEKFERIAHELNNFHEDSEFFNAILKDIDIDFYPKKIENRKEEALAQFEGEISHYLRCIEQKSQELRDLKTDFTKLQYKGPDLTEYKAAMTQLDGSD